MIYTVIIKMSGYYSALCIICGMLHRTKGVYLLSDGKDYDTSRMLPRCPLHISTACSYSFYLGTPGLKLCPLFFRYGLKIFPHHGVGKFFCHRGNGSRFKGLSLAEYDLCIGMGFTLVLV